MDIALAVDRDRPHWAAPGAVVRSFTASGAVRFHRADLEKSGGDRAGQLKAKTGHLEASVEKTLNDRDVSEPEEQDALHFCRLLAALRKMSENLVKFQRLATSFSRDRLRESRF